MANSMWTQTVNEQTSADKFRWFVDAGDVDSDIEGYAVTLEAAQNEADLWAGFCPFAYVYIYDVDTNKCVKSYWAR